MAHSFGRFDAASGPNSTPGRMCCSIDGGIGSGRPEGDMKAPIGVPFALCSLFRVLFG